LQRLESGKQELRFDTYSEEHRHECEVKWLVSLDLVTRRKVLGLIGDARGIETQKRIQMELIELWKSK
jgi:hypothetical protein